MTKDKETPELLPCPFCGGEAAKGINLDRPDFPMFWYLCTLCHASPGDRRNEAEAIAAWNTRLASTPAGTEWRNFHKDPPQSGAKVVIVCDDGCSTGLALITDDGALDGEDGMPLGVMFLQGAIWTKLPDSFPLAFMEALDDY
jgi:Lar family restriction alleviation protein